MCMADTSVSYQCANCNAPLAYEPGEEKVTCAYCGTEFAVSDLEAFYAAKEESGKGLERGRRKNAPCLYLFVVRCGNCL